MHTHQLTIAIASANVPVTVLLLLLVEQAEEELAGCKLGCYIDRKCVQRRSVPNAISLQLNIDSKV